MQKDETGPLSNAYVKILKLNKHLSETKAFLQENKTELLDTGLSKKSKKHKRQMRLYQPKKLPHDTQNNSKDAAVTKKEREEIVANLS